MQRAALGISLLQNIPDIPGSRGGWGMMAAVKQQGSRKGEIYECSTLIVYISVAWIRAASSKSSKSSKSSNSFACTWSQSKSTQNTGSQKFVKALLIRTVWTESLLKYSDWNGYGCTFCSKEHLCVISTSVSCYYDLTPHISEIKIS